MEGHDQEVQLTIVRQCNDDVQQKDISSPCKLFSIWFRDILTLSYESISYCQHQDSGIPNHNQATRWKHNMVNTHAQLRYPMAPTCNHRDEHHTRIAALFAYTKKRIMWGQMQSRFWRDQMSSILQSWTYSLEAEMKKQMWKLFINSNLKSNMLKGLDLTVSGLRRSANRPV